MATGPVSLLSPRWAAPRPQRSAHLAEQTEGSSQRARGQKSWLRQAIGHAGGKLDPGDSRISRNFFCKLLFPSPGFPQSPLMKSEWGAGARRTRPCLHTHFSGLLSTGGRLGGRIRRSLRAAHPLSGIFLSLKANHGAESTELGPQRASPTAILQVLEAFAAGSQCEGLRRRR